MKRIICLGTGIVIAVAAIVSGCEISSPSTCIKGMQLCNNAKGFYQICNPNGEWGSYHRCNQCDNNRCLDEGRPSCDNVGEIMCHSQNGVAISLTCIDNYWTPQICESGLCDSTNGCQKLDKEQTKPEFDSLCIEIQSVIQSSNVYALTIEYENKEWVTDYCSIGFGCNGDKCQSDTDTNCGNEHINCYETADSHIFEVEMTDDASENKHPDTVCNKDTRKCEVISCKNGYYLNSKDSCVENSEVPCCVPYDDNNCGEKDSKCKAETQICDVNQGKCVCSTDKGYQECDDNCVQLNDPNHCGDCETNCEAIIENHDGVTCEKVDCGEEPECTSSYQCKATQCKPGYHLYEGMCVVNDNDNCGEHEKACTTDNVDNSELVTCNTEAGECQLDACIQGYHKYNGRCEKDDNDNCGEHELKCEADTVSHIHTVSCDTGVCLPVECDEGFTVNGRECTDKACECVDEFCPEEVCLTGEENKGKVYTCDNDRKLDLKDLCPTENDKHKSCKKSKDDDGHDITVCGDCTNGDRRCTETDKVGRMQTCVDGQWVDDPNGSCNGNSCNSSKTGCGECKNDAVKCDHNNSSNVGQKQTCSGGKWGADKSCDNSYSCNSSKTNCGSCKNTTKQCKSGSTKVLQTCTNGAWSDSNCTTPKANATPICKNNDCTYECNSGYTNCGGSCVDTKTNLNHCGACDKKCTTSSVSYSSEVDCSNSSCKATACNYGYHLQQKMSGAPYFAISDTGKCEADSKTKCGGTFTDCSDRYCCAPQMSKPLYGTQASICVLSGHYTCTSFIPVCMPGTACCSTCL